MDLRINNEKINVELEKEEYLSELLDALELKINNSGGIITAVLVNDRSINFTGDEWKQMPINAINTLYIEADTPNIARIRLIETFISYISVLLSFNKEQLNSEEQEKKDDFFENSFSVEDIQQIVSKVDKISLGFVPLHSPVQVSLHKAFMLTGLFETPPVFRYSAEAGTVLEQVLLILEQRKESMRNHSRYWIDITRTVLKTLPEFQSISTHMSTTDYNAMSKTLVSYTDFFHLWLNVLRTAPASCSNKELWKKLYAEHSAELNAFWTELATAMENNDWVSAADTIEYELSPVIEKYAKKLLEAFTDEAENFQTES